MVVVVVVVVFVVVDVVVEVVLGVGFSDVARGGISQGGSDFSVVLGVWIGSHV